MMKKLTRNNKGDTIIEVLIALSVIGLAIGITYSTANKSTTAILAASQTSDATSILKSQIEFLRSKPQDDLTLTNFCFDDSGVIQDNQPTVVACTLGGKYAINISKATGATVSTYTAKATWRGPGGLDYSAQIVYRY